MKITKRLKFIIENITYYKYILYYTVIYILCSILLFIIHI